MGIIILIRHAKTVINDGEREERDTIDEENVVKIKENLLNLKSQLNLSPADKVEVWTAPAAKVRLTGEIVGGVFKVQSNCTKYLHQKEYYSDRDDEVRVMSEMLSFFEERLKEVKILIAVSHAPEVASFTYFHARSFAHSAREIDHQNSYYKNGSGVIIDFDAKTVRLFPK